MMTNTGNTIKIGYKLDTNRIHSYPTKPLPNLSQTLPVVPLTIKGSKTNSTSVRFNRSWI